MKTFAFLSHMDLNLYLFRAPIIKELILRGHKVYVICPIGRKNEDLKKLGCEIINYAIDRKGLNPICERKYIDNIYNSIKNLKIDILHTFNAKPNIYGTYAAKKAGIPIIINLVEGMGSFYTRNNIKYFIIRNIMEYLYKKTFTLSNGCIFVNTSDPEYLTAKKIIKKEKVKIIKSVGIDTQKFSMNNYSENELYNIKKYLNLEKDKLIILMVSRAIWDKGIKEYYEAANILKSKYTNLEFLFVGETDEGNYSCASTEFLNSGVVKWLGYREDIANITAICDIYVLPSYREGLPVTLLEASSMAKPIVTTDTVGCKDVVDNNFNGFLVPIKNSNYLTKKISELVENKELRIKMGQNALKKVKNLFDIKNVVKQYMDYYETFI